jgi:hypothetical protein
MVVMAVVRWASRHKWREHCAASTTLGAKSTRRAGLWQL